MRKIYLYYAAIFLIMVSMADTCRCGGNKKEPCPVVYMEQDLKDYCVFKPGTWWVYEEETSKKRDSVYTVSSITSISECENVTEVYEYNFQNTFFTRIDRELVRSATSKKFKEGGILVYFNANLNDSLIENETNIKYTAYLENVSVANSSFTKVKVMRIVYSDKTTEERLYAKNLGLVKKDVSTGEKWNLIKFNIVQ